MCVVGDFQCLPLARAVRIIFWIVRAFSFSSNVDVTLQ